MGAAGANSSSAPFSLSLPGSRLAHHFLKFCRIGLPNRSLKTPELPRQSESIEDGLILRQRTRTPFR